MPINKTIKIDKGIKILKDNLVENNIAPTAITNKAIIEVAGCL